MRRPGTGRPRACRRVSSVFSSADVEEWEGGSSFGAAVVVVVGDVGAVGRGEAVVAGIEV